MAKVIQKKKAAKPVKKATKPAPKKAVKTTKAKAAPKKAAPKKAAKPAPKKAAPKKVVKAKPAAKKPVPKKAVIKKPAPKAKPVKKAVVKKPVVKAKATPKPVVKAAPAKNIVKPDIKKPQPKPAMKSTQKNPVERSQPTPVQRHAPEGKPQMEVSVVRYSDADLAMFKEVILKKIAKAKEEIDFYSDQIRNSSESETQFASIDDGSMTSERENMNQIVVRMQKLISHLETALVRIENKSYGICRETGRLIPKERLLVVPHATLSVEGKKMEKK